MDDRTKMPLAQVVIITDKPNFGADLACLAQELNHQVRAVVTSVEVAVDLMVSELPDAIILDDTLLERVESSGADKLSELPKNIPVIIAALTEDNAKAAVLSARHPVIRLQKPVDIEGLKQALDAAAHTHTASVGTGE